MSKQFADDLKKLLHGAVDGFVDGYEEHVGKLEAEIERLRRELDEAERERESLRRRLSNTQIVLDDFRGYWPKEYCIDQSYPCEVDGDDLERLDEQMRRNRDTLRAPGGGDRS